MKRMVLTNIGTAHNTVSKSIMFTNFRASLNARQPIPQWWLYPSFVRPYCFLLLVLCSISLEEVYAQLEGLLRLQYSSFSVLI